jgi:perosamine synthetase
MNHARETMVMPGEPAPSRRFLGASSRGRWGSLSTSTTRHRFFWARNALYYALRVLGLPPGTHVLLPSYLCTAAIEPFLLFGASVEFYDLGTDLSPDFADLESRIRPETGAVLAVHYFGFPAPIGRLRELCDRRGIRLIEDCAHVLVGEVSGRPLGSFGDASIFSWRKFLPLYDGADLQLNRPGCLPGIRWNQENLLFTCKVAKCLADRVLERSKGLGPAAISGVLEFSKALWKKSRTADPGAPLVPLDSNALSLDRALLDQPISRISRWLLDHSNVSAIVQRRRQNFLHLHERLRLVPGVRVIFNQLPPTICPWVYPVLFVGLANAHLSLRERGIPAVTWGGVRSPLVEERVFQNADFLYENLVFLPIHQDLDVDDLDLIARAVVDVTSTGRASSAASQPAEVGRCA